MDVEMVHRLGSVLPVVDNKSRRYKSIRIMSNFLDVLSGIGSASAYTLVIFLFFSHNYDFLPKKVIKMVRIFEKNNAFWLF